MTTATTTTTTTTTTKTTMFLGTFQPGGFVSTSGHPYGSFRFFQCYPYGCVCWHSKLVTNPSDFCCCNCFGPFYVVYTGFELAIRYFPRPPNVEKFSELSTLICIYLTFYCLIYYYCLISLKTLIFEAF